MGSACLRWLLRQGHDPIAFDDLSQGNAAAVPDGRLVIGDIQDRAALEQALRDHRAEAVMHFATVASVPESGWMHSCVNNGQTSTFGQDILVAGQLNPIPEPTAPLLFGAGLLVVGRALRRRTA